jgi:hypothetical protein
MESRANSSLVVKPICLFFFDEILSLSQQFRQKRYCLVQERVYVVLVSLHFRRILSIHILISESSFIEQNIYVVTSFMAKLAMRGW